MPPWRMRRRSRIPRASQNPRHRRRSPRHARQHLSAAPRLGLSAGLAMSGVARTPRAARRDHDPLGAATLQAGAAGLKATTDSLTPSTLHQTRRTTGPGGRSHRPTVGTVVRQLRLNHAGMTLACDRERAARRSRQSVFIQIRSAGPNSCCRSGQRRHAPTDSAATAAKRCVATPAPVADGDTARPIRSCRTRNFCRTATSSRS